MGDPVTIGVMSLASVGLSAASKGMAASGAAEADQFKAQQLQQAAEYGELKATQTHAQMTRNLTITLGNIDAVRAAARADPTSPTGAAVRDYVEETGETQARTTVDSILQQSREDEAGAAYMRKAAGDALLAGDISIAGTLIGGLGGAFKSTGGAA